MSASEVGVGYVRLLPSMRGFSSEVRRGIAPIAVAGGRDFGGGFARGFVASSAGIVESIGRTVMAGVETVGMVAGGVLAASITGGVRRLMGLEDASRMLDQLGVGARDQRKLMDSLLDSLLGTPFALDEGASAMTNFVSSGRDLDEIPRLMNQVVDAAGFGKAPLNEVAEIWNRIGMTGRVTNRELQMLTMRNIPAYTLLADAIGVSEEAIFDMASSGQLSADLFFDAWEQGAKGFGDNSVVMEGAAKSMGDTTRGALANMLTAASRFGANLLGPVFGDAKTFFSGITAGFDELGARVGPVMERLADSPGFRRFRQWLVDLPDMVGPAIDWMIDKFRELGPAAAPLAAAFGAISLGGLARALGPLGAIIPTISPLVAAFAGLVATSPELREAFKDLWVAAEPLLIALGQTLMESIVKLAEVAVPLLVTVIEDVLIPVLGFLSDNADIAAPAILGLAAAMWILNAALLASPWTLAVLGVVGLAVGIGIVASHWDEFVALWNFGWGLIQQVAQAAIGAILLQFGRIVAWTIIVADAFLALPGRIADILGAIPGVVADVLARARDAAVAGIADFTAASIVALARYVTWVRELPGRIVAALARLGNRLRRTAEEAWGQFRSASVQRVAAFIVWVGGIPERVVVALGRLGARLYSNSRTAWAQMLVGARERAVIMIDWVRLLPDRIVRALGNLGRILYDAGRQIIGGLRDGMVDAWVGVSSWLVRRAYDIQQLKGPLAEDRRLLTREGHAIIGGLGEAMRAEFAELERWLSSVAPAIEMQLAPAGARGARAAASPVAAGTTLQFGDVTVGDRSDFDELSVRMRSWQSTYG